MVNGSAPYCLIKKKKNAMTFRDSCVTFLIIAKNPPVKQIHSYVKKNLKFKNIKIITSNYKGKIKTITKIDKKIKNT